MVTQELITYIKTQLSNGNTVSVIRQSLALKNWQQADIDQAFALIEQSQTQPFRSQPTDNNTSSPSSIQNSSGMGNNSIVPEEIKGFNWGAFLWNWIWAISNNTWIGLLALLPFVGFIMAFILGFKGREWAWKNKHWDSMEAFNKTQKSWVKWWLIIVLPLIILSLLGIITVFVLTTVDPLSRFQNEQDLSIRYNLNQLLIASKKYYKENSMYPWNSSISDSNSSYSSSDLSHESWINKLVSSGLIQQSIIDPLSTFSSKIYVEKAIGNSSEIYFCFQPKNETAKKLAIRGCEQLKNTLLRSQWCKPGNEFLCTPDLYYINK